MKHTPDWVIILILGAMSTLSPFAIDMYLPAFPEMATAFGTSATTVSLSVAGYFIGFAVGQVIYGPLLDRFGRRIPLYIGLTIFVLASLGCMSSTSINGLIFFRVLQALGGCVSMVASMTMVRDFFHVDQAAKVFSLLVLVIGVSPLLAPTVGSFVVTTFGWKSVFAVLAGIAVFVGTIVALFLPPARLGDPSVSLHPVSILRGFREILLVPQFYTYAIAGALAFAGLFVYVGGSPVIFMDGFKVSAKTYGAIFAALSVGFIGGSQLNILLMRKFKSAQIFKTAVLVQVVTGAVFLGGTLLDLYGFEATLFFFFIMLSSVGIASPNASALALAPFTKNAGRASALLGFLQIGIGAIASTVVGALNLGGSVPTIATMAGSALLAGAVLLGNSSKIKNIVEGDDAVVLH